MGQAIVLFWGIISLSLFIMFPQVSTSNCHPIVFAFGDSNTDTGGANALYGSVTQYPNGCIFPYPPSERASNGRLVIDFLCESVNANYLNAYLNSLDEPDFTNGVNFAIAGASTSAPSISLKSQVFQFQRFWNRSLELHSKGSGQNMVGEEGFKQALYIIDIEQNDLGNIFGNFYSNVTGNISKVVTNIQNAVEAIYTHGGRKFWIHNTGPLGCLPYSLASYKTNATGLDQIGRIKYLNEVDDMFNKKKFDVCKQLGTQKNDATIVYVDVYAIKYDVIVNATSYGFQNPLTACIVANKPCANQSQHISCDGIHYTNAANFFVAPKIITGRYSTPPLPFNFFCGGCN